MRNQSSEELYAAIITEGNEELVSCVLIADGGGNVGHTGATTVTRGQECLQNMNKGWDHSHIIHNICNIESRMNTLSRVKSYHAYRNKRNIPTRCFQCQEFGHIAAICKKVNFCEN
ncbi:hypothetical protein MAR_030333 [Mya arenaria]|uniref:CCHC-type domain-containing protein n=1 Tax=Mya arenaria TaxID=6604 RepID=A0ABY7DL80_MYAAR|nr:hypothetical protein MAR_030333 [Mya arenaria]